MMDACALQLSLMTIDKVSGSVVTANLSVCGYSVQSVAPLVWYALGSSQLLPTLTNVCITICIQWCTVLIYMRMVLKSNQKYLTIYNILLWFEACA